MSALTLCLVSGASAATAGKIAINVSTTTSAPLAPAFSGFNVPQLRNGVEYYDPKFVTAVTPLKPGWLRFPAGTASMAYDWNPDNATGGHINVAWMNSLITGNPPQVTGQSASILTNSQILTQAKGGVWLSDFAAFAQTFGSPAIICFNGYTDTNPDSAGLMAQAAQGAGLNVLEEPPIDGFFVKEAVLPFKKLPSNVTVLGPEMRSTGEVMGHASTFGHAFAKSQLAAGTELPLEGMILISVNDFDKGAALKIARDLHRMGFQIAATPGTADYFRRVGLPVVTVNKVSQGSPHVVDYIQQGRINLILNTPLGPITHSDGALIRAEATKMNVPLLTTLSAAAAAVLAIRALRQKELMYRSLQAHYAAQNK